MTWQVEYLTDAGRHLGRLANTYPYIFALLSSSPHSPELVYERARNYVRARAAELERPLTVTTLPYHLVLDPCDVCNLACPLCVQATDPHGRRRRTVTFDRFEMILGELDEALLRLDLFNWGEPLLHPRFPDLVAAASRRSIYTRTSTHLSHAAGIPAVGIVDSGLDYLVASIDGTTQDVYGRYRAGGVLATVLRNAAALADAKSRANCASPILEWQFLAFRHNVDQIAEAGRLARELGFDIFRYGGARGEMANRINRPTIENFRESSDYLLPGDHIFSEYTPAGTKLHAEELSGCRWLWGKVAIHPDGGISPCWTSWRQRDDFGVAGARSLPEIWRDAKFTEARRTATSGGDSGGALICHSCAYHRSFVNAPDRREESVDTGTVTRVAAAMGEAGMSIAAGSVNATLAALEDEASGHSL